MKGCSEEHGDEGKLVDVVLVVRMVDLMIV